MTAKMADLKEINELAERLRYGREAMADFEVVDERRNPRRTNVARVEIKLSRHSARGGGSDVRVVLEEADACRYVANEVARLEARLRELGVTP